MTPRRDRRGPHVAEFTEQYPEPADLYSFGGESPLNAARVADISPYDAAVAAYAAKKRAENPPLAQQLRQSAQALVRWPRFDQFFVLAIVVNMGFLAAEDPQLDPASDAAQTFNAVNQVFTVLFCVELVVRVTAMGPRRFLSTPWTQLDLIVVFEGVLSCWVLSSDAAFDFSTLKMLRVLRPLRTITHVPTLRVLVTSLLRAIPLLGNVLIVCAFYFVLFAVVGQVLWQGKLNHRCYAEETGLIADFGEQVCGYVPCAPGFFCADWKGADVGPSGVVASFDNAMWASLTIFECITLEGWTDIMYVTQEVSGAWTWVYFIALVFLGAYVVLNLTLAVLLSSFHKTLEEKREVEKLVALRKAKSAAAAAAVVAAAAGAEDAAEEERGGESRFENETLQGLRERCHELVVHWAFDRCVYLAILLNTIVLALDSYDIPQSRADAFDAISAVLAALFGLEMCLKLFALGFRGYTAERFNIFDGAIVCVTGLEYVFAGGGMVSSLRALRAFRALRALRVTRISRYMKSMDLIISIVSNALGSIGSIFLLLLLFLFIYAVLGRQLYGGIFPVDDVPRSNFDTFHNSLITVFQTLSPEGWNIVLYNTIQATGTPIHGLYFASWVIFGHLVLLNLLLAVLLDTSEEEGEAQQAAESAAVADGDKAAPPPPPPQQVVGLGETVRDRSKARRASLTDGSLGRLTDEQLRILGLHERPWYQQNSLLCITPQSEVRVWAARALAWEHFDSCVLCLIVLSSLSLLLEDPSFDDEDPSVKAAKLWSEVVFNLLFAFELTLKAIADGLLLSDTAMLRDHWNVLDLVVVSVSLLGLVLDSGLEWVRVLRLLRCLRPLQLVAHNENLQQVVRTLMRSLVGLMNVMVVLLLFFFVAAVMGMQLMGGSLHYCADPEDFPAGAPFAGDPTRGIDPCGEVVNAPATFDNCYEALLTLFIMASGEGWPEVLYWSVDGIDPEHQPIRDYQPVVAIYFVIFIFCGCFFFMDLFAGVLFDNYMSVKRTLRDTKEELDKKTLKRLLKIAPLVNNRPPDGTWRATAFDVENSQNFTVIVIGSISLNVVLMLTVFDGQPQGWTDFHDYSNVFFTLVFIGEMLVKLTSRTWRGYFEDSWNILDFSVVGASIFDVCMLFFGQQVPLLSAVSGMTRLFRLFRVLRVMRLARSLTRLRALFMGVWLSLPSILNVGLLLGISMYMFSILGMIAFGDVVREDGGINVFANFGSFPTALLTLFRVATGEGWNELMWDARDTEQEGTAWAPLFFVSYVLVNQFILINLFIMTIVDNYERVTSAENCINDWDIVAFQHVWAEFDPDSSGHIHNSAVRSFLHELPPPMQVRRQHRLSPTFESVASHMGLVPDENSYVYFNDVLKGVYHVTWGKYAEMTKGVRRQRSAILIQRYVRVWLKVKEGAPQWLYTVVNLHMPKSPMLKAPPAPIGDVSPLSLLRKARRRSSLRGMGQSMPQLTAAALSRRASLGSMPVPKHRNSQSEGSTVAKRLSKELDAAISADDPPVAPDDKATFRAAAMRVAAKRRSSATAGPSASASAADVLQRGGGRSKVMAAKSRRSSLGTVSAANLGTLIEGSAADRASNFGFGASAKTETSSVDEAALAAATRFRRLQAMKRIKQRRPSATGSTTSSMDSSLTDLTSLTGRSASPEAVPDSPPTTPPRPVRDPEGARRAAAGEEEGRQWEPAYLHCFDHAHSMRVTSVATGDGVMFSADAQGLLCVWGKSPQFPFPWQCKQTIEVSGGPLYTLALLPQSSWRAAHDRPMLFSGGKNGEVRGWALNPQAHTWYCDALFGSSGTSQDRHSAAVVAMVARPRQLITSSLDGTVRTWSLKATASTRAITIPGTAYATSLGYQRPCVLMSTSAHQVMVWNLATEVVTHSINVDWAIHTCIADGGLFFAAAEGEGSPHQVAIWDAESFMPLHTLARDTPDRALAINEQMLLFCAGDDCVITVFDLVSGAVLASLVGHDNPVVALAADSRNLFSASADGRIVVWALNQLPQRREDHPPMPEDVATPLEGSQAQPRGGRGRSAGRGRGGRGGRRVQSVADLRTLL